MHASSIESVKRMIATYLDPKDRHAILDVGSCDVNGTYRPLFDKPHWTYVGIDMAKGKNVDLVVDPDFRWDEVVSSAYSVVVCGQVMEHVTDPATLAKATFRACAPGGYVFMIAPWQCAIHRYPIDCWRILPDGMRHLMTKVAGFEELECAVNGIDTVFAGRKPCPIS